MVISKSPFRISFFGGSTDYEEWFTKNGGAFISLALAVLGVHGPNELFQVVNNDDISSLCLVPGVGKKTATRLLVELKSVLKMPIEGISIEADNTGIGRSAILEVQEALDGLGYSPEEIRSVLGDLAGDDSSVLLREALQKLATA